MTGTYVPGTGETDPKKINMSLQQVGSKIDTATANIAAIQAALPATIVSSVATSGLATGGPIISTGTVAVTAASKSDQTTGSSNAVAVTPLHQQDHDSAAKAWVSFTGSTGAILASYNVASVTRTGAGLYTVAFTTAFATANYVCLVTPNNFLVGSGASNQLAASIDISFRAPSTATATDPSQGFMVCFGRQ